MRVALFSGNYNYLREGANQALNRLARHLEDNGHEVRAYSPATATPAFEPAGTLVPVPSIALPLRSEFRLALGLPRAARREVERFAPDIVHLSTPDILNLRAQSFAMRAGIPIVASQHTRFETYLGYYGLDRARPLVEAHLRRFYRRADHVLAPTPALVADMKALRGDDRVSMWSRGVDTALFDPARRDLHWRRAYGIEDDETLVLFFGRLVLEKGVAVFASAVRELQAAGARARPLIVGAGPAAGLLDTLPGALSTGHLEGEDLARAIASADLLLHPSVTETFGNVVLEAMASGLPVIAGDAPSARTLIEDGRTGRICDPMDAGAFARTAMALIERSNSRQALGAAAREASLDYSWAAASESVVQSYRTLLERFSPALAHTCNERRSA